MSVSSSCNYLTVLFAPIFSKFENIGTFGSMKNDGSFELFSVRVIKLFLIFLIKGWFFRCDSVSPSICS
jgi:hypothetical protein